MVSCIFVSSFCSIYKLLFQVSNLNMEFIRGRWTLTVLSYLMPYQAKLQMILSQSIIMFLLIFSQILRHSPFLLDRLPNLLNRWRHHHLIIRKAIHKWAYFGFMYSQENLLIPVKIFTMSHKLWLIIYD